MNIKLIYLLPLTFFLLLTILLWQGIGHDPRIIPSPLINKPLPHFVLPQLNNTNKKFDSNNIKGKVSLLNIWATWCVSCRVEHAGLMTISQHYHIPIYGFDYKDNREEAQRLLKKVGDPYQAIAFDADGKVAIDLGVYGAPETFIIDANGIVRYKYAGPITYQDWQDVLYPLIKRLQQQEIT